MKAMEEDGTLFTSKIYRRGHDEGRVEGQQSVLVHQLERRLRRALTHAEQQAFVAQVNALGAERVGDLVVDLDAGSLAAWVAGLTS